MPNYIVGVYQERFGTVVIEANDEFLAAEQAEELLKTHEDISTIPSFEEQSADRGVAIDVSNPEELQLAVTEVINDS